MATVASSWQASGNWSSNGEDLIRSASLRTKNQTHGEGATVANEDRRGTATKNTAAGERNEKGSRWKSSGKVDGQGRQNSLRRVKDSTDMLRERSLHPQRTKKDIAVEGSSGGREGRQFTVGNVGNNGMIYLRPVKRSTQQNPTQTPPFVYPAQDNVDTQNSESQFRDSVWTHMSTPIRPLGFTSPSVAGERLASRSRRSMSESTIEDHLTRGSLESGAVKIVIDRAETLPSAMKDGKTSLPTIEVPIPHYRLGEPRFSARGTAFLHSSVYTRSSVHDDFSSSLFPSGDYDRLFPRPPGMESLQTLSRRHSHETPQFQSTQKHPTSVATPTRETPSPILHQPRAPILPHIYDALAAQPNDPATVRFSAATGEIVAATPARIIAQVTSENFLDYELLSDFFLTVRAYLSTQDLLSYLVARFEWAINRFDDNGRVIRVRAFAALRHWILNYFSYDFVMDRDLRVKFCDRLNALTRVVHARANYGASDMKLISDLKKCWNGRCMLYWDNPTVAAETYQEVDIQPGGIVGSRDSQLSHPSQLQQPEPFGEPIQMAEMGEVAPGSTLASWYNTTPDPSVQPSQSHNRHSSVATTRSLPISPGSEQSIPVLSCSIPAKGFKKVTPYANRALGIHPVPTNSEGRRMCPAAPSAQANEQAARPATAQHRRSGSFSDAARDKREPLSSDRPGGSEDHAHMVHPYAGSLIRGNVVSPVQPYVSMELSNIGPSPQGFSNSLYGNRKIVIQHSPGMKQLLGNIRRVLSSKNNTGSGPSSNAVGSATSIPSLTVAKGAAIPMSVMYNAVAAGQLESFRSNSRVDLLAVDVIEAFNQAIIDQYGADPRHLSSIGLAYGNDLEQPAQNDRHPSMGMSGPDGNLAPPDLRRMDSGITNGSQSILIADDTGLNVPDIPPVPTTVNGPVGFGSEAIDSLTVARLPDSSLFVGVLPQELPSNVSRAECLSESVDGSPSSMQQNVRNSPELESYTSQAPLPTQTSEEVRSSLRYRGQSFRSNGSGSVSLRRYASYQSTFAKHSRRKSIDVTNDKTSNMDSIRSVFNHPPAHVLRRRPGGDLKASQNVHDLEDISRPKSAGSITTYSDSLRGSGLLNPSEPLARTMTARGSSQLPPASTADSEVTEAKRSTSFVRTHSSQPALRRPSFEAAVADLAQLPDDEEGGIEATLLKLEGKYQKTPVHSPTPPNFPDSVKSPSSLVPGVEEEQPPSKADSAHTSPEATEAGGGFPVPASLKHSSDSNESSHTATVVENSMLHARAPRPTISSILYTESEESYNSTPLLERGIDQSRSDFLSAFPQSLSYRDPHASRDSIMDTQSMRRLKHGSSAPTVTTDSFLLDEDDDFLSDLSSEMSLDFLDRDEATEQPSLSQAPKENTVILGDHPPSPPMTMENAMAISSQANQAQEQRRPPTPDPSPVSRLRDLNSPRTPNAAQQITTIPRHGFKKSRHLCFILGYDAELLAQQFTIIEKDALNEIDWRDLVDMRWQHTATNVTNWVEYLRSQDAQGIDLVAARSNIMAKWALSEIILTQHIEERALTIMKYIHIAREARKLRNYATVLQLTMALTAVDCARLMKTWDLVGAEEKQILKELEDLVTPRKNFHNLRQEMEKANAEQGCIPVVALYIHDLTYNSQKPSLVASVRDGEPLVNFERYRSTALIVKNLLRLIDASSKYTYQPVDGVIERCLWMASLSDEAIRVKSKSLE
ncbi:Guanine nucleotide exchange factor lte1 [Xylographa opegraphella]|nr:Guanine nucleotide exchange factor lte1 [Xylographa opegraphella]